MGCCVSTNENSRKEEKDKNFQEKSEPLIQKSRAPPPVDQEITVVKEVLSETPNFKSPFLEINHKKIHIDNQKPFLDNEKKLKNLDCKFMVFHEDENLSASETVSTVTFNNNKNGDQDQETEQEEEIKQRVKRSPVSRIPRNSDLGSRKGRVISGKSPSRRAEQSPNKRNSPVVFGGGGCAAGGGGIRIVQSNDSSNFQARRRGLRSDQNRKDPGEGSGRRSRSPAVNRFSMGNRSPSVKRNNGSPGRVRTDSFDNMEGKWVNNNSNNNSMKESLENPLVSLECFIFL